MAVRVLKNHPFLEHGFITTNFSQNVTEPSKGINYQSVIFADISQNWLGPVPIHYIVIQYPQQMVQMAFCDLLHTFHKQVTNVSQHVFVILLGGILTSPLIGNECIPTAKQKHLETIKLLWRQKKGN